MTSDPYTTNPADHDDARGPSGTAPAAEPPFASGAFLALPPASPAGTATAVAVTEKPDDPERAALRSGRTGGRDHGAGTPAEPGGRVPETDAAPSGASPAAGGGAHDGDAPGPAAHDRDADDGDAHGRDADDGDAHDRDADDGEPVHTLLRTAATERPLEEVAALVTRLQESGEVSRPADVALRAAAVARPLDEVRRLMALLKESGHDLDQADTTLRAAAVGRPVDDVVELVSILGADSSDWRSPGGTDGTDGAHREAVAEAAAEEETGSSATGGRRSRQKRPGKAAAWRSSTLDSALAAGPAGHSVSPALRSVLRWPAALALFACGVIHVPTDLAGLRSGGYAETLSVAVTLLCLVGGVWLALRDTLVMWAAAAGLAVGIIALHALAGAGTADLLNSSLGDSFTWAKALAVVSAAAAAGLAGTVLVRRTSRAGAAKGA